MQGFDVSEADLMTLSTAGDDAAREAVVRELFETIYGSPPAKMSLAGGRVNLIGEHVDYPDVQFAGRPAGTPVVHLFSMGGAIQNNFIAAASLRSDTKISIAHVQVGTRYTVDIADLPALEAAAVAERNSHLDMRSRSSPEWTFHTLGAVMEMAQRGVAFSGMDLLLTSNVPHGAGMSNSAANCVALGLVFNALFPALNINTTIELTTFARCAENSKFAGGQCGWLDQLLITNSKADHVTKIDYADNSIQHFESKLPSHMQFVAFNTNVPHVLAESDYGHRVRELTLGIKFLTSLLGGNVGGPNLTLGTINALIKATDPTVPVVEIPSALKHTAMVASEEQCTLDAAKIEEIVAAIESGFDVPSELPMHKGKGARESFAVILRRMRHQKMSSLLVPLAGEAASLGDVELFGLLLDLEGQSLRMSGDFMITGDNGAQDAMLDAALERGRDLNLRVHGRMLGGGGGGNVLLFVDGSDPALFQTWADSTIRVYNAWADSTFPGQGISVTVIAPQIAGGARLLF
jgi:galactokinase